MGDGRKDDASSQGSKVSSQIPGLSLDFQDNVEGNATGRRLGVVDTDSNYVKLAKQGGHKGILYNICKAYTLHLPSGFNYLCLWTYHCCSIHYSNLIILIIRFYNAEG